MARQSFPNPWWQMYFRDHEGRRHEFRDGVPVDPEAFRVAQNEIMRLIAMRETGYPPVRRDNLYGKPRRNFMTDNAIIPATKDTTVTLRPSELKLLLWALDFARSRAEGNRHAHVLSTLINKLTDLTGSTEERFDNAVDSLVEPHQ